MASVVLIPSYKPDQRLVELVQALSQTDLPRIVVVDDGSGREFKPVFEQVAHIARVDLLTHKANQGKGAAMRTGLRHIAALPEAPSASSPRMPMGSTLWPISWPWPRPASRLRGRSS